MAEGAIITHSLESALEIGNETAKQMKTDEVVVIGGAEIFRQCLDQIDRIYLTRVHATIDGDTFFPDFNTGEWREISNEFHPKSGKDMFDHSFIVLERKQAL